MAGVTSLEAGPSGAGAGQGAEHLEAEPRGKESIMAEAGPAEAPDTTDGAEAVGEASMEDMEGEEAGVREAAGEVSDREAPSQGQ